MEDVHRKLRFLLQTTGVSYRDAAESMGLTYDHFLGIMDGEISPTERQIVRLAELCNVKPEFLTQLKSIPSAQTAAEAERTVLTLRDLAIRFQALTECLVDKGLIASSEFKKKTEEVTARTAQRAKDKSTAVRIPRRTTRPR